MKVQLFDAMSLSYDQMVIESDQNNEFPYAGYHQVLSLIASSINEQPSSDQLSILDIGIGTGNLETMIKPERKKIYGLDFSDKMLEIAALKNAQISLYHHDFSTGLPKDLSTMYFDYIVSTYALHHLPPEDYLNSIWYLLDRLTPFGKLMIGDIFFLNNQEKTICRQKSIEVWDDSEYYYTFDWIASKLKKNVSTSFMKVSFCSGILIIEKYHEQTLQKPEVLVKY